MHIEEALIQKIKRCNFIEYFKTVAKDDACLEQHGNYYTARCPHPDHNDRHPSFRIWHNQDGTWSFACMGCHNGKKDDKSDKNPNYGTDIIAFVRWMSNYKGSSHVLTFQEAMQKLFTFFHIPAPASVPAVVSGKELYHQRLARLYRRYFIMKESPSKQYFLSRGFNFRDASDWSVGSNGDRLIFPLYDADHRIKGFIGRTICGEDPKYIHSSAHEGFIKSEFLYGMDHRDSGSDKAYVTEGVFDVIAAYKYGCRNVFACLGTAFQDSHARMLKRYRIRTVVFVFDNDQAGKKALAQAIDTARKEGLNVRVICLDGVKDLDEFCQKHRFASREKLLELEQTDYAYELGNMAETYRKHRTQLQNEYLLPILRKAALIRDDAEYMLYRNYIFTHFDVVLEPDNVRKVTTNLADPVSAQTEAGSAAASATQDIFHGRAYASRRRVEGTASAATAS